MRSCFVPGCDRKHKNVPKRKLFRPPRDKNIFAQWVQALPKKRPLKPSDMVCSWHFMDDEVITTFESRINGKLYQLERDRARLKDNAVPSLNIPDAKNWITLSPAVRIEREKNTINEEFRAEQLESSDAGKQDVYVLEQCLDVLSDIQTQNSNDRASLQQTEAKMQTLLDNGIFDDFYNRVFDVVLPDTLWGIHRCTKRTAIYFSYMDVMKMSITKMLVIHSNGFLEKLINSRQVNTWNIGNETDLLEKTTELLSELHETSICKGDTTAAYCKIEIEKSRHGLGVEQEEFCENCLNMTAEQLEEFTSKK